jgi:hypothetical protein
MKYLLSLLFIAIAFFATAQNEALNSYKYIVVNNQYEFQNEANHYRFNELVAYEFKKRNFTSFRNSEVLPADLNRGDCNALQVKIEKSGMFKVGFVISLVDCTGNTVFETKKGLGRTKSFDKAYFEAARDAMTSFDEVDYEYTPKVITTNESAGQDKITFQQTVDDREMNDQQFTELDTNALQSQTAVVIKDFVTIDQSHSLILSSEGYHIFKGDAIIGSLKKSKGGCYLALTTQFMGIGYSTSKGFSIEYTADGKDKVMEFVKK